MSAVSKRPPRPTRPPATWDVPLFVTLDARTRRAIARKLGKPGLVSRLELADAVTELVGDWIQRAVEDATPRGRSK